MLEVWVVTAVEEGDGETIGVAATLADVQEVVAEDAAKWVADAQMFRPRLVEAAPLDWYYAADDAVRASASYRLEIVPGEFVKGWREYAAHRWDVRASAIATPTETGDTA